MNGPAAPIVANHSARVRAVRLLRGWIADGTLVRGEALPAERHLARRLDVGLSTVQRALRSLEAEGLIQQGMGRTRIVGQIQPSGGSLVKNAIALVGGSPEPMAAHIQPGWSDYIGFGAIQGIRAHGVAAFCLNPDEALRELSGRSGQDLPRGLLIDAYNQDDQSRLAPLASELARAGVAVAVYGDAAADRAFDRVVSDHEAGSYDLTKLLLARGRKRILQVGGSFDLYWEVQRSAGYERAMREAGLEPQPALKTRFKLPFTMNPDVFEANWRQFGGYLGPVLARPDRPDALMANSDGIVPMLAAVCRSFGLDPEVDIEIVGYDNYWEDLIDRQWEPARPVATVDKKNYQIGSALAELLFDRLEGRLPPEPQLRILKPELVQWASRVISKATPNEAD